MFDVTVHERFVDLEPLRFQWREAARSSSPADPVIDYDHYVTALESAPEAVRPFVLTVAYGEDALGIVPLVLEERPATLGVARVLRLPTRECGVTAAVVGPHQGTTLTAALRRLAADRGSFDALRLDVPYDVGRTRTSLRLSRLPYTQSDVATADGSSATRYVSLPTRSLRSVLLRADAGLRRWLFEEPVAAPRVEPPPPRLTLVR